MKKKSVFIGFRITEEESIKLRGLMAMMGYRNVSLFIRDQLLRGRVQRRNLRRTEANLSRQVEQLRMEIKRIGVNYNQVVKAVNTLSKLRDRHGNAAVSAASIDGNLTDMKIMMEALLERVRFIAGEVEAMNEAGFEEEPSGEPDTMYNP
jgi:archaellum component FlaC